MSTIGGLVPRSLGARNVSDHRFMSQVGRVREKPYVSATKVLEVTVFNCLRNSCNHVTEVGGN
jgi:hypothetical protein